MLITKNYRHCWIAGGEAWDELSLSSFRGNQSCPHLLSSDFWIKFCGLKPPSLIALLRQPKGTNTFANLSCLPTVTPPKPWEGQEFCLFTLCFPQQAHSRCSINIAYLYISSRHCSMCFPMAYLVSSSLQPSTALITSILKGGELRL